MIEIKKDPSETEESFLWRIGQLVDSGQIDNWSSINDIVNQELGIDEEHKRDESSFRKRYQAAKKFYENCFASMESKEYSKEIEEMKRSLERSKIQYRDERNAWQKQNYIAARAEEKLERLEKRLSDISNVLFTDYSSVYLNNNNENNTDLIVCLSDLHIGQTFNNCFGEYNSQIAKERLDKYLLEIVKAGKRHNAENVYVMLLGDQISGSIHLSIQVSNRENVIEQIKLSAELISSFCIQLSKYFKNVYITSVNGNHSRLISNKEMAIKDERLDNLITWIVGQITNNFDNIQILDSNIDSSIAMINVKGKTYIGVHGDNDSMNQNSIGKLCMMLGTIPYAIVGGHRHTPAYDEFNGVKYIQSGSLAGSGDDHTVSNRLSGCASQTILICNENGIECIYNTQLS